MELLLMHHTIAWISQTMQWISDRYIEVIATVSGLIYLYYSIKGDIKLWFFGLVSSGLIAFVFFRSKIYADMGINLYYVVVSIYGWIHWAYYGSEKKKKMPVTRTSFYEILILLVATGVFYLAIAYILINFTDSTVPYLDSFTTAASITATWMLARKMLEHWIFWIVIDAFSIGLYIYKGLYPTTVLFLVYTIMAFVGYYQWHKQWKEQEAAQ